MKESEPADAVEVATEEHDDEDEGEAEAGGEADSDEDDEDLDEDELAGLKADQGDDAAAEEPVAEPAAEEGRRRPTRGKRLDYAKLAQEQGGDDDDGEHFNCPLPAWLGRPDADRPAVPNDRRVGDACRRQRSSSICLLDLILLMSISRSMAEISWLGSSPAAASLISAISRLVPLPIARAKKRRLSTVFVL